MSVYLCVCPLVWSNSAPIGRIFMKFYIWIFFKKCVGKIQILLKSDKNSGYYAWRPMHVSCWKLLQWAMLHAKAVEKIKTRILWSITFYSENRAVYEILFETMVGADRLQMTVWRMLFACRIPRATNTHSEYVILIAFPPQHWFWAIASMLRHT